MLPTGHDLHVHTSTFAKARLQKLRWAATVALALACGGTDGETEASTSTTGTETTTDPGTTQTETETETAGPELPQNLLITADFQAHQLSVLDLERILAGDPYASALTSTIELPGREPGPLQLAVTDDARALVSISPGFFDGSVGDTIGVTPLPPTTGELLIVDLVSGELLAELHPQSAPMGIAVDPVRPQAITANFGDNTARGTTLSIIDLNALEISEEIEVGDGPEQLAISDDGQAAAVSLASAGEIRGFSPEDPGGTLSPGLVTSADPSGIAFIPGTHTAVIANSQNVPNYTIVDLSDPQAPVIVEQGDSPGGIPFAVAIRGERAWISTSTFAQVQVNALDLSGTPSVLSPAWSLDGNTFPLGFHLVPPELGDDRAVVALPGLNQIAVLDLANETASTIDFPHGPTDLAIHIR